MKWVQLEFSKTQVDRAGYSLVRSADESADSLEILGNWRGAHGFPLNTIQMALRSRARTVEPDPLIARRLKRTGSIIKKLRRSGQMRLSQMQDIGGCRAVVSSVRALNELRQVYEDRERNHQLVNEKNYLAEPPESEYRSIQQPKSWSSFGNLRCGVRP